MYIIMQTGDQRLKLKPQNSKPYKGHSVHFQKTCESFYYISASVNAIKLGFVLSVGDQRLAVV